MDGSCARCGQNIPAWLTFTLGRHGRVYCSEYCQRLDEQSQEVTDAVREVAEDHAASPADDAGSDGVTSEEAQRRKRLRLLSRLR